MAMEYLGVIKVIANIGIFLSLIYLCFKIVRFPSIKDDVSMLKTLKLQIKDILDEAASASESLDSNLKKRKRDLEDILYEVKTEKNRLDEAIDKGEKILKYLRLAIQDSNKNNSLSTKSSIKDSKDSGVSIEQSDIKSVNVGNANKENLVDENYYRDNSDGDIDLISSVLSPSSQAPEIPSFAPTSTLTNQIEKEVIKGARQDNKLISEKEKVVTAPLNKSIEELYNLAEDLLSAGNTLDKVQKETGLDIGEIKMLAEILKRERDSYVSGESGSISASDDRLGVLKREKRSNLIDNRGV